MMNNSRPGQNNGNYKLTESQVVRMIARHLQGEKIDALACEYGVGYTAALQICRRDRWTHIPWWRVWREGFA